MISLAATTMMMTAMLCIAARSSAANLPNIVVLFVDDLGYGDLGFNGHPTTRTPNIDALAQEGRILTSWYSGCPVCSGSRAALMTGRQYNRVGVPGVFGPTVSTGLPLNETTIANVLKRANYSTAICGKWHLGQRQAYLPGARGFDTYLGIPYSDDMGTARATVCGNSTSTKNIYDTHHFDPRAWRGDYCKAGYCACADENDQDDPAGKHLPLVYQVREADGTMNTTVLEQPLDFTTLAQKYESFVTSFVTDHAKDDDPFFLYVPFSHVHTTDAAQPQKQYAGCAWRNSTSRGPFGDALAEVDHIVGSIVASLKRESVFSNTLILFTSDNGPWMVQGSSGGSVGLLYGRNSGYWNVGKGSTWEGGIHEPAFAVWPGVIPANTRSEEVVSSMDVLPTVARIANVSLPDDRVYDGRDAYEILTTEDGKSRHDFLFFYGGASCAGVKGPSAVRFGTYKAHFATGPGLSGCDGCKTVCHCPDPADDATCAPLLFNIREDPSEAYPLDVSEHPDVLTGLLKAYRSELETFQWGKLTPAPDGPGEGPGRYGVCCDRAKECDCTE